MSTEYGPYLYAYWRQDKKIRKKYIGKSFEDYKTRNIAKKVQLTPSRFVKFKFLQHQASKGNALAQEYLQKLESDKVSIDWAHKVVVNSKREARLFRMLAIADKKRIRYDDEIQLFEGIASTMQRDGFDPMNEEELDCYLNSEFR